MRSTSAAKSFILTQRMVRPSRLRTFSAMRAAVATLVIGGIVVTALALWKLKLVIALLFFAFILAASMRPGIEALHRRRVPRSIGLAIHYFVIAGVVALLLWLVVPRAIDQVQSALQGDTKAHIHREAKNS